MNDHHLTIKQDDSRTLDSPEENYTDHHPNEYCELIKRICDSNTS